MPMQVAGLFEFAGAMTLGAAVVNTVESSIAQVSVFTNQPGRLLKLELAYL
jgi:phosphate/sulfate permease